MRTDKQSVAFSSGDDSRDRPLILADAHVHLHECFPLASLLDAALHNFQQAAELTAENQNFQGVLFLAELPNQNCFDELLCSVESNPEKELILEDWTLSTTDEKCSLWVTASSGERMAILAGRQIVTEEGLEVLALVTEQKIDGGLSLTATLESILAVNGIPVLPWGVGKWIGRRGRVLQELLDKADSLMFFLGDNGGRPIFWRHSIFFKQAQSLGLPILPGTDPLPLTSEYRRPGSFGFQTRGLLNLSTPGRDMRAILTSSTTSLEPYGFLETPVRFLKNQILIRL